MTRSVDHDVASVRDCSGHLLSESGVGGVGATRHGEQRHLQLVEAVAITQRRMVEIFTVLSRLGAAAHPREPQPLMDSPELARIFAAHPEVIRCDPVEASRILRALTLSMTHPMIAGEQATPEKIVEVVLHGIGRCGGSDR